MYIAPDSITLPGEVTKNKKATRFPISKETYDTIQSWPRVDDSEFVFPASRTHVRGKPVEVLSTAHFSKFRDECGIAPWQLRDCRKTFATAMERLQVPLAVTEAFLNHTGVKGGIVGVYQRHDYFPEMQAALKLYEAHLSTLAA